MDRTTCAIRRCDRPAENRVCAMHLANMRLEGRAARVERHGDAAVTTLDGEIDAARSRMEADR